MLACVSQFYSAYEETLNTLKYAQRACQIKNVVTKNMIKPQVQEPSFQAIKVAQQQLAVSEAAIKQREELH